MRYLLAADSSTHRSLQRHELANIRRRNLGFPTSIALTLRTLGHAHTGVLWVLVSKRVPFRDTLLGVDHFGQLRMDDEAFDS